LYSLCTLRANISVDYATLGYDCWLGFIVQDWLPAGFFSKGFKEHIYPPFTGFAWRNLSFVLFLLRIEVTAQNDTGQKNKNI
jgi:hypothetical protein